MEIIATQLLIAMGFIGVVGLITYLIEYLKTK